MCDVGFCAHIVVEVKLGHASQVPRLVEIWFGVEHLVEILY